MEKTIKVPETTSDERLDFYEEPLSPHHELLVWEKWIQIRKEETAKLGKKLKRPPVDLVMNLPEKIREDKERKIAIEHAQIEKKPTTIRGSLFDRPPKLRERCSCDPIYEIHLTRAEKGHPRVIEHVSVPTCIKKTELGMSGEPRRKVCDKLENDYKNYMQKRERDLKQNLRKIDPFKPSTSQLMIQGFKPKTPPRKMPPGPEITVDAPTNNPIVAVAEIYAVRINKSVFYKEIPGQTLIHIGTIKNPIWNENCTTWTYYFNVPVGRVGRGKLCLQNLGTVTLRYCWKKLKRTIYFIPEKMYEQVFFFNKNEDVISPGQCKEICFTFISNEADIYSESWELSFLNVNFLEKSDKFIIDLCADSIENIEAMEKAADVLKNQIKRNALYNFGSVFVNEIFNRVFAVVPQTYPYKKYFLESELFVMKNPVCFYHQTEVSILKDLYNKEMTNGQIWDLSIGTWRKIMMSKEYDDRMKYFDALKKGHSECLKPWHEGEGLLREKYRAINNLWRELAHKLDKEYERIHELVVPSSNRSNNVIIDINPLNKQRIRNIFYLHTYDHVATTIELCAGILSSLDSNKWIEFDFCRT